MTQRIGTIIHGALGDCYEQLLVLRLLKARHPDWSWVGFFARPDRLLAMSHFELDMLDEVHAVDHIPNVPVEGYFQMQVRDPELREEVIDRLPAAIRSRFDLVTNHKPWAFLRRHDFRKAGLKLELSAGGLDHYRRCLALNRVDPSWFGNRPTVGFLWRYRGAGSPVSASGQRDRGLLLTEINELFERVIRNYDAHLLVCGMMTADPQPIEEELAAARAEAGVLAGEVNAKYAKETLHVPENRCTYLRGLGYAAEMEIMAKCDLLLLMPSGFSEPLWMRRDAPVMLVAPPPHYLAKLVWNRMPLFESDRLTGLWHNVIISASPRRIWRRLVRQGGVTVRPRQQSRPGGPGD